MTTEKGIAISTEGEYEMDAKGVINPTKLAEKLLSEVEKAQADVKRFTEEITVLEQMLFEKKTYLGICKRSLKSLMKAEEKFKKIETSGDKPVNYGHT